MCFKQIKINCYSIRYIIIFKIPQGKQFLEPHKQWEQDWRKSLVQRSVSLLHIGHLGAKFDATHTYIKSNVNVQKSDTQFDLFLSVSSSTDLLILCSFVVILKTQSFFLLIIIFNLIPSSNIVWTATIRQSYGQSSSVISKHTVGHIDSVDIFSTNFTLIIWCFCSLKRNLSIITIKSIKYSIFKNV